MSKKKTETTGAEISGTSPSFGHAQAYAQVDHDPAKMAEIGEVTPIDVLVDRKVDAVYAERNAVVCALARAAQALGYPAWRGRHPAEDEAWEADWRTIVYVRTEAGQVSWHVHDSEAPFFDFLPVSDEAWDGHTTPEKYERLAAWRPARR